MNINISFTNHEGITMKKNTFLFLLFLSLAFCSSFSAQERYNALVFEGNKNFDAKNYDRASSQYLDAIKLNEKDFAAHYNLGNTLYKKKLYPEAQTEYQKAETLAKNKADKMAALYNQGNVAMQQKKPENAAQLYKKALKLDPYNETIRKNFEISMLKKEEQQKQNKDNENNKSEESQDNKGQGKEKGEDNVNDPQQNSGGEQKNKQGTG
jgi:tetratricopeptide (TPR) repeat protein